MAPPKRNRQRNRVYSPWSNIVTQTGWSVSGVRAALANHEMGEFSSSGMLIDMLGRDDRLGSVTTGVIGTRANGLLGKKLSFRPANETAEAQRVAEEIERVWWQILPESELKVLLRYYWLGGGAPAELRWERREGRWFPVVRSWQLFNLYREEMADRSQLLEHWWLQTRDGQVDFTPGDGKWLLLADGERWWLNGSVRSLSIPWLGKQYAFRDWLRHSERLGHPILKAMYPAGAADPEVDDWFDDLKALAAETTAKLPQFTNDEASFDLHLLESAGHNWESFQGLISHVDTLYAVHVLGHNLTTEVQGGSYAASSTGNDVRLDYIRSDAETLSTILREQVLAPVCSEWYSGGAALAPWPHWDVDPPEDTKEAAETAKLTGEALQALELAGYRPKDIDAVSEKLGFELEAIPEDERQPAPESTTEPPESDEEPSEPEDDTQLSLASGDPLGDAPGVVGGQAFADEVADEALPLARRAMGPDVRSILATVDGVLAGGGGVEAMREALTEQFAEMIPAKLAELLEKAEILAELKGMASVLEDL